MKHKAKTLNGEWVEGYYLPNLVAHRIVKDFALIRSSDYTDDGLEHCSGAYFLIDPSTLCQQVRGTQLFEGDEVETGEGHPVAYVEYCKNRHQWLTRLKDSGVLYGKLSSLNWKPTGKNKHDEKAKGDN